jgi:hypothetical protein
MIDSGTAWVRTETGNSVKEGVTSGPGWEVFQQAPTQEVLYPYIDRYLRARNRLETQLPGLREPATYRVQTMVEPQRVRLGSQDGEQRVLVTQILCTQVTN